jgi:hypothetical protein
LAIPYEKTFELLAAASAANNYFELRFPARGTLRKIVCVQLAGVEAGFELDIYNSQEPVDDAEAGSSSAGEETFSDDAYKVIPTQQVAAAGKVELMNCEYPYKNQDGTATRHIRKLWARIRPAGSGEKDFQLTLAVEMPDQ